MTERRRDRGAPAGLAPGPVLTIAIGAAVGAFVVAISWNRSRLWQQERWWAIVATVVVAAIVAVGLPRAQRLMPTPGVVPACILASLVAIYGCVPETDQIPPVAVTVGALVLLEVVRWRRVLLSWHAGAAGIVLWAGVYGATGRQSALIGALFAFWPVVIVPLVAEIWPRTRRTYEPVRWFVALIGAGAAVLVARTGALEPTGGPAVVAVAFWGAVSLALGLLVVIVGSLRPLARNTF